MNKTITDGALVWPADPTLAQKKIMSLFLKIIEKYEIHFDNKTYNPIQLAKYYLTNKVNELEIYKAYKYWQNALSFQEQRSPFYDHDSTKKRLALCLLFNEHNKGKNLTYCLDFFAEVLDSLGCDLSLHYTPIVNEHLKEKGQLFIVC